MDVFHVSKIVQVVPNRTKHHIFMKKLFKEKPFFSKVEVCEDIIGACHLPPMRHYQKPSRLRTKVRNIFLRNKLLPKKNCQKKK